MQHKDQFVEYTQDLSDPGYLHNWYVQHNMMCMKSKDTKIVSWYFCSFFFGVVFFFLPDYLGRKKTMSLVLIPVIIGNFLIVFSDNLKLKSLGFAIHALFHLRLTLSYTVCYELIPERYRNVGSTFINFYDIITMIGSCCFLKFV